MPAPSSISPKMGSTPSLKDVEELRDGNGSFPKHLTYLLPCALMHFSSLCYFTFQHKSLKIGLCDKFFYFTCFATEPGTCAMDMSMS